MSEFQALNDWVIRSARILNGWASLITIISLPSVLVGLVLGYIQLADALEEPDARLEFVHPKSVCYKIVNQSDKIAEDVLVSFGLFDLDSQLNTGPLPIISASYDYVNKRSAKGPFGFLANMGTVGHRYFGIVYVGCRGGERLRTYWVHFKHGSDEDSYFAERSDSDPFEINVTKAANDKTYLEKLVPTWRRTLIKG